MTTPNPSLDFLLTIPQQDLVELDTSVDEGRKMIISMGGVVPGQKSIDTGEKKPI